MADVIFVVVIVAFFGVALALVKACDRIIGPDLIPVDESTLDGHGRVDATPEPRVAEPTDAVAS